MTACLYPVKDGIEVYTRSDKVLAARRGILSLLLARCPNSDIIRSLAEQAGARIDGLTTDPNADNCILCGLCTRICETYATGAITTVSRGAVKRVSSFANQPPEECIGCGACVIVCPTGEIQGQRTPTDYQVWERSFPTAICTVNTAACIGCGSCEEACPFSVARVALRAGGDQMAVIPEEHCRGCGVCVGACPTGAITQRGLESNVVGQPKPTIPSVFACARSNLTSSESAHLFEMPCVGRISTPLLLHAMASGAPGVLVLGRHQSTCRLNGSEDSAQARVRAARDALDLLGLDPRRIQFEEPAPGPDGPRASVARFQSMLASLEKPESLSLPPLEHEGLDTSLALINKMSRSAVETDGGARFLEKHGLPTPSLHGPVLLAGCIPILHTLGKELFAPLSLVDALRQALDVLEHLGIIGTGIRIGAPKSAFALEKCGDVTLLDDVLRGRGRDLPRPAQGMKVAFDGTEANRILIEALGYEPVDIGSDPLPDHFSLTAQDRKRAVGTLAEAERAGAHALLVANPRALARWAMMTRAGSWRSHRVQPILGVQLAYHAVHGLSLAPTHPNRVSSPCMQVAP